MYLLVLMVIFVSKLIMYLKVQLIIQLKEVLSQLNDYYLKCKMELRKILLNQNVNLIFRIMRAIP